MDELQELRTKVLAMERQFARMQDEALKKERDMLYELSVLDAKNFKGGMIENDVIIYGARSATFIVGTGDISSHKYRADYLVTAGATNAQEKINEAINALSASGGMIVLLEGTYTVDGSIELPNNVTLKGQGYNTIVKIKGSLDVDIDVIKNSDVLGNTNITIKGFAVDGNKANNVAGTQNGVILTSATNAYIGELLVKNCRNTGIYLRQGSKNTITGNICEDNERNGIWVNLATDNTVYGNTCQGNLNGIELRDGTSNTITGNICQGNFNEGISFSTLVAVSKDNTITGNTCQGNAYRGINLYFGKYNTLSGNTCQGNDREGIRVYYGLDNTVTGNACMENGQSSNDSYDNIMLDYYSSRNNVQANTCRIAELMRGNTATAGSNNTITLDANASSTNDYYKDKRIRVISGTGSGQNRLITTYDGTTKVATVDIVWKTNPDATSVFRIYDATILPRYGIRINSADCDANLVTNNDVFDSGATADLSDAGTGTITTAGNRS